MLEVELFSRQESFTPAGEDAIRRWFYRHESDYVRETRALKTRSIRALQTSVENRSGCLMDEYEVIKILGKGSFGVVRLVREKIPTSLSNDASRMNAWLDTSRRQVYAMKVIRKSDMLRTSQEGHLRTERDLLVASEGSRW